MKEKNIKWRHAHLKKTEQLFANDMCVIVDNFVEMGDFSVFQKVKRKKYKWFLDKICRKQNSKMKKYQFSQQKGAENWPDEYFSEKQGIMHSYWKKSGIFIWPVI